MENSKRRCPICAKPIKGRLDKKFCSTKCKNDANYQSRKTNPDHIKRINGYLFKNRMILHNLMQEEEYKGGKLYLPRIKLLNMGFQPKYATNFYTNSHGKTYSYIYDYGWMEFSGEEIMIIKVKKM